VEGLFPIDWPRVPGHEVVGRIDALGSGVQGWAVGQRVGVQATKLLDPDPIVRRMAEQDLLVMGRATKPYLDQVRARVRPKLQLAIDRMWERIVREGR
jgi:hypothetical protein